MKKKLLAGLLATATTVSMMAAVPVFAEDAETIKIGTLYPLTGDVRLARTLCGAWNLR